MLKVELNFIALSEVNSYKKGECLTIINNVFDEKAGVAFFPIDKRWKLKSMKLLEYKEIIAVKS